jgi:folate-binding protein YgfZ
MQLKPLLIDLTTAYTSLLICGPQAEAFLQGQLTCDLKTVTEETSTLGAHCNLQGRMVSLFRLYRNGNDWHLILPSEMIDITEKALKHYARFSKVTLTREQPKRVGIIGNLDSGLRRNDTPKKVINHLGGRIEFIGVSESLQQMLSTDTQPGTLEQWHLAQINAGEVFLTPETSGEFLPHDINLPQLGGVSFTKGCFLGQEIVARMEYLGKRKKHMHQVNLPTEEKIICSAGNQALVI